MAGGSRTYTRIPVAVGKKSNLYHANLPKYRLAQRLNEPKNFTPTVQWSNGRYLYRIDGRQLVCKRIPIKWRRSKPEYYAIKPYADTPKNLAVSKPPGWYRPILSLSVTSAMAALCLLVYPYYPEVKYNVERSIPQRVETQAVQAPVSASNQLTIPKIGVTAAVLESPDLGILDREQGVWHQTGKTESNLVLAGHRFKYLPPNTTTFYNLGKLEPGDTAVVDYSGKRYVYVVREVKTVKATEVEILKPTTTPQLTLYTCSDKRETERIVVHADLLP